MKYFFGFKNIFLDFVNILGLSLIGFRMIQQVYQHASSSFWPCLTFFELKITKILKSSRWGLEKSELLWELNFLQLLVCFLSNYLISLPSFNGLCCKLAKIALFIYVM